MGSQSEFVEVEGSASKAPADFRTLLVDDQEGVEGVGDYQYRPPNYIPQPTEDTRETLEHLQGLLETHETRQDDQSVLKALEEKIFNAMERLSNIHPDHEARRQWAQRAFQFAKGPSNEKETILQGLKKGLIVLSIAPLAIAGAAILGSGAIIYGTGKVIVAIGHVLTFGQLHKCSV